MNSEITNSIQAGTPTDTGIKSSPLPQFSGDTFESLISTVEKVSTPNETCEFCGDVMDYGKHENCPCPLSVQDVEERKWWPICRKHGAYNIREISCPKCRDGAL